MALNIPSLVVSAVTTFDGKALSKGSKQISAFEKGAKKAGGALAAAFSVQAIVKFGKEAAKAFIEDQKAASQLAQSVKNLGLAFETPKIERFISELSAASGVADDVLRPSMQKLLQTTGSVTKSQELLTQALDISRGSGVEYGTVVADLSAAYVGNTKGLKKYSLGLTNAELTSMSFSKVQEKLTSQFSGANAAYLATYAGQLELLNTAAGEAKESIGKGLVTALQLLAGEGNTVQPLADSMADFGTYIGDAIIGTGVLIDKLNKIPGMGGKGGKLAGFSSPFAMALTGIKKELDYLSKAGKEYTAARTIPTQGYYGSMAVGIYPTAAEEAKRKKAADDAAKREKQLAAEKLKNAKLDKQKIALNKAAAVFDSTRISIAAALQSTYDKETKLRLEALMLIEEDKGDAALKKIGELAAFQKNADMQRLAGVETISNATLGSLNTQLLTELKVINSSKMAEGDKELAREEAFKKYNAAITAAGTLMAKESYNERVQIQLTEIARLAAISKTYSAAATANLLLESAELSMIDRVAIAQKAADDQRLAALKEYQNALKGTGSSGGGGGGGTGNSMSYIEKGPLGGLAAGVIAGVLPTLATMPTLDEPAIPYGWNPTMGFPGQSVELTINTGIGDPEAIARAVEDLLNQSSYRGTSVNRGSGNYIL
jgi:hypothetical protein